MTGPQSSPAKPEPALVDLMLRAHSQFVDRFDLARFTDVSADVLRHEIRNAASAACDTVCAHEGVTFSPIEREWLLESVLDQAFGFGPLEALLKEPGIDTIFIRGPRDVLAERDGHIQETAIVFRDEDHVRQVLERNRLRDCMSESGELETRSIRIDVRRLKEAFAEIDASSNVGKEPAAERPRARGARPPRSWVGRLLSRLLTHS